MQRVIKNPFFPPKSPKERHMTFPNGLRGTKKAIKCKWFPKKESS